MDGFAGYKTAAAEVIPDAVTVMDPFYDDLQVMPIPSVLPLVAGVSAAVRSA